MSGVSLKIDANSKSFQAEMKSMLAQMKLVTSEYKLSAAQAKAMGSSVDELKAKETELTAKIGIQSNIIEAYESKLKEQKTILSQLEDEESRLKTKKEQLTRAYEESVQVTGEDSEESRKLKEQLDETKQAHTKAEKAVEKQKTAIQNNTTRLYENRAKLNDLNSALETNQQQLKDAEDGMDDFSDEVEDAGKSLEEAGQKGITFGDLIKANVISDFILSGIHTLADGIKSIAASSIDTGKQFSSSMSQVAATMGMTADEIANGSDKFSILENAAREMGASTKYSASEAADALNYLALAGYSVDDATATLPTVLNLAAAGGIELADASDMVTDAMSALGLGINQADSFVDQMAKTSQKSNTNVAQLGEAILTVGGTAKNMAGGVTEMNTVLGILADNGIKGAEGGTALRNMILSLASPTSDKAIDKMEQLGLKVFDVNGNMRPMNEIFKDLNKTLGTMTQEERTQVLNTIFNKVDLKSVNALLANSGERFEELSGYIDDCGGAAADMAETMSANLEGSLASLNSATEDFQISIYKKIGDPLKGLVDIGTDSVRELTSAFETDGTSGLIKAAGNMISGFINKGLEYMPDIVEIGVNAVNSIVQGLNSGNGTMSVVIASLIGTMVSGAGLLLPNFLDLGVNMLVSMGNGIASQLPSLIPQMVNIVIQLAGKFIENLPAIVDCGINLIASLVQGIINSMPMLITQVPVLINEFWNAFDGNLGKILLAGGNLIMQLAQGLIDNLPLIKQNAGEIIQAIFNTIMHINFLSAGKTLMTNLRAGISSMGGSIGNAAKSIGNKALNAIKNINWVNLGKSVITFIKNGITGAAGLISSGLRAAGTQGLNALKNINWLSLGKSVITFVKNGITGAASLLGSALKAAGKGAITAFKSIDFKSVGKAIIDGIKSGLKTAASGLASAAADMARSALGSVKKALGIASPSRIFKEQVGLMMGAGVQIGFEDSMKDARKSMAENMQTLIPDITADVNPVMQVKKSAQITQNDIDQSNRITANDISSRTDETIVIYQTNVTYLDGEEISNQTTKKVVKKISRDEKNRKIYKGEFVIA